LEGRSRLERFCGANEFNELTTMTVIEIRPYRNGWKCFEAPGVEPVFLNQEHAIDYATGRACFRSGEIRVLDSSGEVERIIAFSEADRKL
jgi:hypothetical protein